MGSGAVRTGPAVSWLEVVKGTPNHGVVCFVSRAVFVCFSFVFRVYVMFCFLVMVVSTNAIDCLEDSSPK